MSESQSYPFETKLAAVKAFHAGSTKAEILVQFNIRNETQLERWITDHRQGGEDALQPKRRGRAPAIEGEEPIDRRVRRLEMENAALKKWLALAAEERQSSK